MTEFGLVDITGDGAVNYTWGDNWINWLEANNYSWMPMCVENKYESMSLLTTGNTKYNGNWDPDADLNKPFLIFLSVYTINRRRATFN